MAEGQRSARSPAASVRFTYCIKHIRQHALPVSIYIYIFTSDVSQSVWKCQRSKNLHKIKSRNYYDTWTKKTSLNDSFSSLIIILTLALCILLLLYILITTMDGGVVAWRQSCGHAPCRTSVARRPEPAPTTEGNAWRFRPSPGDLLPTSAPEGQRHTRPRPQITGLVSWAETSVLFLRCPRNRNEFPSCTERNVERPGSPLPLPHPRRRASCLEGGRRAGGRLVWDQPCRVLALQLTHGLDERLQLKAWTSCWAATGVKGQKKIQSFCPLQLLLLPLDPAGPGWTSCIILDNFQSQEDFLSGIFRGKTRF